MDATNHFLCQIKARIQAKSTVEEGSTCTLWQGALTSDKRYGRMAVTSKKTDTVHRLVLMVKLNSLELPKYNDTGEKLEASHLCGKSLCTNPEHLVLESHEDNMARLTCHNQKFCSNCHQPPCIIA